MKRIIRKSSGPSKKREAAKKAATIRRKHIVGGARTFDGFSISAIQDMITSEVFFYRLYGSKEELIAYWSPP